MTTTLRIRGDGPGLPLDVASTVLRLVGTAYPATTMSTATGRDTLVLHIDDADRGETEELIADAQTLVEQVTAETYGAMMGGFNDGAVEMTPPEFLSRLLVGLARMTLDANPDALNYVELNALVQPDPDVEMTLHDRDQPGTAYAVIVARSPRQTPHQLRMAAEQRAESDQDLLATLSPYLPEQAWSALSHAQKDRLAEVCDIAAAKEDPTAEPMRRWWR